MNWLSDFFYWWEATLAEMFGRPSFKNNGNKTHTLSKTNISQRSKVHSLGNRGVVVEKPAFILRKVSNLVLPKSIAMKAALLDLEANTPFSQKDVEIHPVVVDAKTHYAIVKKEYLVGAMSSLNSIDHGNVAHVFKIGEEFVTSMAPVGGRSNWLVRLIVMLGVSLPCVTLAHAWLKIERAEIEVRESIETIKPLASEVRSLIVELDRVRRVSRDLETFEDETSRLSVIIEDMSRLLPIDAFVESLSFQDATLKIDIVSAQPMAVADHLSHSEIYENVRVVGRIDRVLGTDLSRASFEMDVVK